MPTPRPSVPSAVSPSVGQGPWTPPPGGGGTHAEVARTTMGLGGAPAPALDGAGEDLGLSLNPLNRWHQDLLGVGFEHARDAGRDVYYRAVEGFGSDGHARLERAIVGDTEEEPLYLVVEHNEDDGGDSRTWNSPAFQSVAELEAWCQDHRKACQSQTPPPDDDALITASETRASSKRESPAVFVGWAIAPSLGAWVDCTKSPEEIRAAIERIKTGPRPVDAVELVISDDRGFPEGMPHIMESVMHPGDPEELSALGTWVKAHEGYPYIVEAFGCWVGRNGMDKPMSTTLRQFATDLQTVAASEADFAEERWKKLHPSLSRRSELADILPAVDWDQVWQGWESDTFWSGALSDGRVAIFRYS